MNAGNSSTRIIRVKVKPNARVSTLEEPDQEGLWVARLQSPPVESRANRELVELIARRFACPKSTVTIKSGATGRIKLVQIGNE